METAKTEAQNKHKFSHEKSINVGPAERWISMISGGMLTYYGLKHRSLKGMALAVTGGLLVYRGKTRHCPVYEALGKGHGHAGVKVKKSITIDRAPEEVYDYWHNFGNLPNFMEHLESVSVYGDGRSHWTAKAPGGIKIEWDAETTQDIKNELIAWRSLPDSDIQNEGRVLFKEASGGRSTELELSITYYPPGGDAGVAASKMLNFISEQQISDDLQDFKQSMEQAKST